MPLLCPRGRRCPTFVGVRIKVLLATVALLLSHHSTLVLLASGAEFDTPLTVRSFALPATIANNLASVVPSTPPVVVTAAGDVYVAYYDYLTAPVRSAVAVYHANAPTAGGDLGPPPGVEVLLAEGSIVSSMASLAPPPPSLTAPTTNDVLVAVTQLTPDAPSGSFLAAVDGDAHPPVRWAVDRRNTTTLKNVLAVPNVALAVFLRPLATSIDVAATTTAQELVAVNTTTGSVIWTRTFNFPSTASPAEQQQPTLTYYTGYLYFFTGDILNRLHAATGTSMGAFNSPCNVSSTDHPISWFLGVSTFSYEANGNPLDAFIVYGNTSVDLFTMCRFSHNTGATEWVLSVVFPLNFMVDDICGGAGNLFLSGHAINASAPPGSATSVHYYTFVVNATSGHLVDFPYVRYAVDARSYPRLLPPVVNDNCVGDALGNNMMVQQIGGRTMAYCAAVPYLLQWISEVPCYHTPLIVTPPQAALPLAPLYGVACAAKVGTTTPSIAMLHADSGDVLWYTTFDVGAPMATDHVYVYAVDPHGVLTQFSVAPASSALGPHPAGGLTSGETALVVVLVLVAVGGGGFATMRSRCGAARRRRAVGATQHESAPGDGVGGAGSSVALNRQEYGTVVS